MAIYRIQYIKEIEVNSNNAENALRKAIAQNKIAVQSVIMVRKK
tara:strand:+ start:2094 stop:2225 length:132 start_codon:yes stop_codon:yes gene_type:complete